MTKIHVVGWIRTRNPSKKATAEPRLRPRGVINTDLLYFAMKSFS